MDESKQLLEYTLCFVFDENKHCLMLQRRHPPHQGLWNALGGKLADGESAGQCCVREVQEEAGLTIVPRPGGTVECLDEQQPGVIYRLHVFSACHARVEVKGGREGELAWLELEKLTSGRRIVHNIPLFLPLVLTKFWFSARFFYRGDYLRNYAINLAEKSDGMPLDTGDNTLRGD